jgi:hypothetical protein
MVMPTSVNLQRNELDQEVNLIIRTLIGHLTLRIKTVCILLK